MNNINRNRPASQEEILSFTMMGQALLNIQVMEEALSMAIALKIDIGCPRKVSMEEVDGFLERRRLLTLGQAIKEAKIHKIYEDGLQASLKKFLDERNWLVHRSIGVFYAPAGKEELWNRIKNIAVEAHRLQREIEDDLINFAQTNGLDMSSIRNAISHWQH